jgi:hypothetical protein
MRIVPKELRTCANVDPVSAAIAKFNSYPVPYLGSPSPKVASPLTTIPPMVVQGQDMLLRPARKQCRSASISCVVASDRRIVSYLRKLL